MNTPDWHVWASHFAGELSSSQERALLDWIDSAPEHRAVYEQMRRVWEAGRQAVHIPPSDTATQWNRLQEQMKAHENTTTHRLGRSFFSSYYGWAAAAIVCVLIGIGFAYWPSEPPPALASLIVLSTTDSARLFYLPDSSRTRLNKHSQLTYTPTYGQPERGVKLEGEAFFEVRRDEVRPFVVRAAGTQTRVLGTSFNVKAYHGQPTVEVTVVSGKVSFYDLSDSAHTYVILQPEEIGTFESHSHSIVKRSQRKTSLSIGTQTPVPSLQLEQKQPARFLKLKHHWRKNSLNQTVLEGTIENTATTAAYTAIKLRYIVLTSQGKQKSANYLVIREVIQPGQTLSYKRSLLDVLTKPSRIAVEIAEAALAPTSNK